MRVREFFSAMVFQWRRLGLPSGTPTHASAGMFMLDLNSSCRLGGEDRCSTGRTCMFVLLAYNRAVHNAKLIAASMAMINSPSAHGAGNRLSANRTYVMVLGHRLYMGLWLVLPLYGCFVRGSFFALLARVRSFCCRHCLC